MSAGPSASTGGDTGPANRYTAPKPKKIKPDRDISLNKTYSSSREIGLMNQNKKGVYDKDPKRRLDKTKSTQKMKDDAFRDQGAYNTRRSLDKLPNIGLGAVFKGLSEPLQKNSIRNRDFFKNKVLTDPRGLKNFGYTKEQFEKLSMAKQNKIYGNYITTRRDNKTDGFGTVITEGNDTNSNIQAPLQAGIFPGESDPSGPSIPLDPQPSETEKKYDVRKTKKKGRNQNLLTSARGVMKTSPDYSLGKKSLLGQVV